MRLPQLVGVFFLLPLSCNPAGSRYSEAEKLVDAHKFDEARTTLNEVKSRWPDKPEARLIPDALLKTYSEEAKYYFEQKDYLHSGTAFNTLEKQNSEKAPSLLGERFSAVANAGILATNYTGPMTLSAIEALLGVAASKDSPPELVTVTSQAICERLPTSDPLKACTNLSPDIAGLSLKDAKKRLDDAERACSVVSRAAAVCSPELGIQIKKATDEGSLSSLRANYLAAEGAWRSQADKDANAIRKQLSSLGTACADAERQRAGLESQMQTMAIRNQMFSAMQLVTRHDSLVEKKGNKEEEINKIREGLKSKDWPQDLINAIDTEAAAAAQKCQ